MTKRTLSRMYPALVLLIMVSTARESSAARIIPPPLLIQFERGFGIVAADVVSDKRVSEEQAYPGIFEVVFRVHSVAAQPVEGAPFPLRQGDSITLRLTVGYACQIEDQTPAPGQKYFLSLKRKPDGSYEHIDGASAPRIVDRFTEADFANYVGVRELAGVPKFKRLDKWLACVQDPNASQALRSEAIGGLWGHLWPSDQVDPEELKRIVGALRHTWADPQSNLSINSLEGLDYLLRSTDRDFDRSAERATGWLDHFFAPTPELRIDDNDRDNLAYGILRDLMLTQPQAVGQRLTVELANPNWPIMYRRAISAALIWGYCKVEHPDPVWEAALQAYYSIELRREPDSFAIRMMAADIKSGLSMDGAKRPFIANTDVRAMLGDAMVRFAERSRTAPPDVQAGVAVQDCKDTLDALAKVKPAH